MRTRWYGVAWQRDGFDVLNCLNGNTHRLTLLDLRSDTGNPNSIGFIRAYAERRLRRATSLALGPERLYLAQAEKQIEWGTAGMGF